MTDTVSPRERSRIMSLVRGRGNRTTEQTFYSILHDARIAGWRRHLMLPGKPDFAFRDRRVAVFLDGCFWHGCPRCFRLPETNRAYWQAKVDRNRRRDRRVGRLLRAQGWIVLRVWEHALKQAPTRQHVVNRLKRSLARDLTAASRSR